MKMNKKKSALEGKSSDSQERIEVYMKTESVLTPIGPDPSIPTINVHKSSNSSSPLLIFEGRLKNHPIRVLVDGGAQGNFVSKMLVRKEDLKPDETDVSTIILADRRTKQTPLVNNVSFSIGEYRTTLS